MTLIETALRLKEKFGGAIEPVADLPAENPAFLQPVFVDPAAVAEICLYLRDEPCFAFDFLNSITGVDVPSEGEIHVCYLMTSLHTKERLLIKARLHRETATVNTVSSVWAAAEWLEREVYDLLGVTFEGNRDMRRIMMPDDWPGHPLRKDYKEQAQYHGMPTTRPDPMK